MEEKVDGSVPVRRRPRHRRSRPSCQAFPRVLRERRTQLAVRLALSASLNDARPLGSRFCCSAVYAVLDSLDVCSRRYKYALRHPSAAVSYRATRLSVPCSRCRFRPVRFRRRSILPAAANQTRRFAGFLAAPFHPALRTRYVSEDTRYVTHPSSISARLVCIHFIRKTVPSLCV